MVFVLRDRPTNARQQTVLYHILLFTDMFMQLLRPPPGCNTRILTVCKCNCLFLYVHVDILIEDVLERKKERKKERITFWRGEFL